MADEKSKIEEPDQPIEEEAPCSVVEPASGHMTLTETSGIWSVFAAYLPSREERVGSERQIASWEDADDFSAEHGYEPGCEGRSEFEHGEFERWV